MENFIFQNPVKLIMGRGMIARLAKEIPSDKRIMITFGGGSVKKNGVYDQVNSLFPMIHSLIATFLFRIPLSYWFSQIDSSSLFLMGFAPPLSTVASLLICIWYLRYNQKRMYSKGTAMPAISN